MTRQTLRSGGSKTGLSLSLLSYFFFSLTFISGKGTGRGIGRGKGVVEERLLVIKEEFGGRKRAGCERGVAAAKERNAIKARSSRLCFFFFFVGGSGQSREEGRDERRCVYSTESKKNTKAPYRKTFTSAAVLLARSGDGRTNKRRCNTPTHSQRLLDLELFSASNESHFRCVPFEGWPLLLLESDSVVPPSSSR